MSTRAESIRKFFFLPASAAPLAALRITLAFTLAVQALLLSPDLFELYGKTGILQESVSRYLSDPSLPRLSWLLPALEIRGMSEAAGIETLGLLYLLSLLGLGLGLFTQTCAAAAWFLHWVLMNTGSTTNYGADIFAHVFLFYLIWMPSGAHWSVDALRKPERAVPSEWARFSLRVLQIHLCIAYLASGLEKAMGIQWWNGEVIWRAVNMPVYYTFDMTWMALAPWLAKILAWGTLVAEIGYAFFIWPRRTRKLWVALMVSLHVGILVFLGLGVFGAIMSFLTLSVFGISATPRRVESLLEKTIGVPRALAANR